MYTNRNKVNGESLLRGMFDQNRRTMANLSAFDGGMSTMTRNTNRNGNYLRGKGQMWNNYDPTRSYRSQVKQIPAKSIRLNDQCFDFGQRNNHLTGYRQMNSTSKFSQSPRVDFRRNGESVRRAPYQLPVRPQENVQQTKMINDEPKLEPRNIWNHDEQLKSKINPKVTAVKPAADISLKCVGVSDFLSPSPYFPGAENYKSTYQKNEPENKHSLKYDVLNFDKPNKKPNINQKNTVAGKWATSNDTFRTENNEVECLDDEYPEVIEKPVINNWVVPPELNQSIESGKFYVKVCEAVLEKVLQLLCPNSYRINQKPDAKPFNTQPQTNRTFNSIKNVLDGFARNPCSEAVNYTKTKPFQTNASQHQFNRDYKKYTPKPLFYQPYRGRNVGRVFKRRIDTRNRESLV